MDKHAFDEAKRKNNICRNDEANDAIEFVLDLLHAEKLHLETTVPTAYSAISRLDSAKSELCSIANDLLDLMD